MFPAAFWDVKQKESTGRLPLSRGMKWQRIEDVPNADQEAVVRYVIKDKLIGKPVFKRVDLVTHGKVVFFAQSSTQVKSENSMLPSILPVNYRNISHDLKTSSKEASLSKKSSSKHNNGYVSSVSTNDSTQIATAHEASFPSMSTISVDCLVQILIEFNGIKRGLDTMWRHMGVETNRGLCLYPEEAMFLMQSGEFQALSPGLHRLSVQHLLTLSKSPYCLFRVYCKLSGFALKPVRHQPHVGFTDYERKIKLDQHSSSSKAISKKKSLKHKELMGPPASVENHIPPEVSTPVDVIAACKLEPSTSPVTDDLLDKEMMEFYSSLGAEFKAEVQFKEDKEDENSLPEVAELSEEWLLEYEESKQNILKGLASMDPYSKICTIRKDDNFLPRSFKVLTKDYVLHVDDLYSSYNVRRHFPPQSSKSTKNQNFDYHNWNLQTTTQFDSDSEKSEILDSDIETSSSSDSESVSSLSDTEDVSYQGWYIDWNNIVYMKRVIGDEEVTIKECPKKNSTSKRSLSSSEDSSSDDEKRSKIAKFEKSTPNSFACATRNESRHDASVVSNDCDISQTKHMNYDVPDIPRTVPIPSKSSPSSHQSDDSSSSDSTSIASSSSSGSSNDENLPSPRTPSLVNQNTSKSVLPPENAQEKAEFSRAAEKFLMDFGKSLEEQGCLIPCLEKLPPTRCSLEAEKMLPNGIDASYGNREIQNPSGSSFTSSPCPPLQQYSNSENNYVDPAVDSVLSLIASVKNKTDCANKQSKSLSDPPVLAPISNPPKRLQESPSHLHSLVASKVSPPIRPKEINASPLHSFQKEPTSSHPIAGQLMREAPPARSKGFVNKCDTSPSARLTRTMINNSWRLRVKAQLTSSEGATREICSVPSLAERLEEEQAVEDDLRTSLALKKHLPYRRTDSLEDNYADDCGVESPSSFTNKKRKKRLSGRVRGSGRSESNTCVGSSAGNVVDMSPNGLLRVSIMNNHIAKGNITNTLLNRLDDENLEFMRTSSAFRENDLNDTSFRGDNRRTGVFINPSVLAKGRMAPTKNLADVRAKYESNARDQAHIDMEGLTSVKEPNNCLPARTFENNKVSSRQSIKCSLSNRLNEKYCEPNSSTRCIDYSHTEFDNGEPRDGQIWQDRHDPVKELGLPEDVPDMPDRHSQTGLIRHGRDGFQCRGRGNDLHLSRRENQAQFHGREDDLEFSERGNDFQLRWRGDDFPLRGRGNDFHFQGLGHQQNSSFHGRGNNSQLRGCGNYALVEGRLMDYSFRGQGTERSSWRHDRDVTSGNSPRGIDGQRSNGRGHCNEFSRNTSDEEDIERSGYQGNDSASAQARSNQTTTDCHGDGKDVLDFRYDDYSSAGGGKIKNMNTVDGRGGYNNAVDGRDGCNNTVGGRGKYRNIVGGRGGCGNAFDGWSGYGNAVHGRGGYNNTVNGRVDYSNAVHGLDSYGKAINERNSNFNSKGIDCDNDGRGGYGNAFDGRGNYGNSVDDRKDRGNLEARGASSFKNVSSSSRDGRPYSTLRHGNTEGYGSNTEGRGSSTDRPDITLGHDNNTTGHGKNTVGQIDNRDHGSSTAARGNARQQQRHQQQRYRQAFRAQESALDQRVVSSVKTWRQYRRAVEELAREALRRAPSCQILFSGPTKPLLGPGPPAEGRRPIKKVQEALQCSEAPLLAEWLQQQNPTAGSTRASSLKVALDVYGAGSGYGRSKQLSPSLRVVLPMHEEDFSLLQMLRLRRHHADAPLALATYASSPARPRLVNFPSCEGRARLLPSMDDVQPSKTKNKRLSTSVDKDTKPGLDVANPSPVEGSHTTLPSVMAEGK
ncbi:uncharacterized protein LOC108671092 isoform X2 [Hyalella azteca]|uniref:Uncharacterized protein LOC108671092 isoform X2 n=1 Tax=Hyalella azteca TaxID=294128 RepID=A0A979FSQ2_HYAAZ|nr:uncharacterized protein LOC108671092 isoform X2 [Hyalella azteca]